MVYRFQDLGYQVTVGDLKLYGDIDENGVAWGITGDVDGWDDSADTTLNVSNRIWGAGSFSNTPFDTGKTYTITGQFTYPNIDAYHAACAKLKKAVSASAHSLIVNDHGVALQATVKRSGAISFKRKASGWCIFSFQEHADSPYRYNALEVKSGSTWLPRAAGGLTYPYSFLSTGSSWQFSEHVIAGKVTLINNGSASANTLIRIDGRMTNPRVEHEQTGLVMSANISLGVGHYLVFDMNTREVLVDGTDPQQSIVHNRQWLPAQTGLNTWLISSDNNEDGGTLTVSFREAYI